MILDFIFDVFVGFDWDKGNIDKNFRKHDVTNQEAEEIFNNEPYIFEEIKHSLKEERLQALGKTNQGRLLFVSFTVRKVNEALKVRVISARDVNKKEEVKYEKI